MTDELDSRDEDDNCDDMPNVVRFNEKKELQRISISRLEWNFPH